MDFYTTTYSMAYGQLRFRPCLGHHTGTGYVINNQSAVSSLLRAAHCPDTVTSTMTEHFKPFQYPDGRSLLPRQVHRAGSGYLQQFSPSCLHTGTGGPQHTQLLQGHPKAPRGLGTESCYPGAAWPGVLQKMTIGTKEQSGFTKAIPRNDNVLPALPSQPLGVSVTTMDYLSPARGHDPLRFTANQGQYVTPRLALSPAAPAHQCQDPPGTARPTGDIRCPSGFATNNHPTGLGDVTNHPPA